MDQFLKEEGIITMREILFRGKRKSDGKWWEGYLTVVFQYTYIEKAGDKEAYRFVIDPETVGQFTGLTDKNGKRIFEGDIVQYTKRQFDGKDIPVRKTVTYEESGFAVDPYFLNNWLRNVSHGNIQLSGIEVVGNIYDNPDILKRE